MVTINSSVRRAAIVEVRAPSRLHFGLLSFESQDRPSFGGVGAMIDRPGIRLCLRPAERLTVTGAHRDRTAAFARRFLDTLDPGGAQRCWIDVMQAPDDHVGLGTGTQLGLAVTAGMNAFFGCRPLSVDRLAAVAGRGRRSSVGSYGFHWGGLLFDEGKGPGQGLGGEPQRVALPTEWRWLLMRPKQTSGLSGQKEERAFRRLPPIPTKTTDMLLEEVQRHMLPAARAGDLAAFGESVHRYGVTAGLCFASRQAGAFATEQLQAIVDSCRNLGVKGVGQSSWGPTIFALFGDAAEAKRFQARFESSASGQDLEWTLAAPDNTGVRVATRQE